MFSTLTTCFASSFEGLWALAGLMTDDGFLSVPGLGLLGVGHLSEKESTADRVEYYDENRRLFGIQDMIRNGRTG